MAETQTSEASQKELKDIPINLSIRVDANDEASQKELKAKDAVDILRKLGS